MEDKYLAFSLLRGFLKLIQYSQHRLNEATERSLMRTHVHLYDIFKSLQKIKIKNTLQYQEIAPYWEHFCGMSDDKMRTNNFLIQETMEDIDKDGDGKINLAEYIGKSLETWNGPFIIDCMCISAYGLLLYRWHVHTREWWEWAWLGADREGTILRVQRHQQGKRTKKNAQLSKQHIYIRFYNYVFCVHSTGQ